MIRPVSNYIRSNKEKQEWQQEQKMEIGKQRRRSHIAYRVKL